MIDSTTNVRWMDVKSGQVRIGPVSSLFQSYAHKAKKTTDYQIISFDDNNEVKITDMYGWTKIIFIKKITNVAIGWVRCWFEEIPLIITDDTIIPIYDPNDIVKGFHGETKYGITYKSIRSTTYDDLVRIKVFGEYTTNENEFRNVNYKPEDQISDGYIINTKSNFYNANNVHLTSL